MIINIHFYKIQTQKWIIYKYVKNFILKYDKYRI